MNSNVNSSRPINGASPPLIVNLSRIGEVGGLRNFAESVVRCLGKTYTDLLVVMPSSKQRNWGVEIRYVPKMLGSSTAISWWRPLLWWFYANFMFPGGIEARVLGTTHHVLPRRKAQIVTIHDLRPYFFPDSVLQKIYFRQMLPRAVRRCAGVLTVSRATRDALISTYNVLPEKIYVVPNAVDVSDFVPGPPTLHDRYLLMVGCTWRHKNVDEVLANSALWMHKYRLVLVMGEGQYKKAVATKISEMGLQARVTFSSNVTKQELVLLYQGCSALLYPSLMEGFGIPPLEAMACGRPVIVSDIPVFRELYCDIPFYVSLGDRNSWVEAFQMLENESELIERTKRGVALATSYSFDRMCSALNTALRSVWRQARDAAK